MDGALARRRVATLDIDGVVADTRHRLHYLDGRRKDWAAFFAAAPEDPLLPEGAAVAARLGRQFEIVYVTGRPERCRRDTRTWLSRNGLPDGLLVMRRSSDRRPSATVKTAAWRDLLREADVVMAVDDNPAVVAAAQRLGIATLLADWSGETRRA